MDDIVEEYCYTYNNWKQTHYSQPVYEKLVDLYSKMTPDQKAKASERLVSKYKTPVTDYDS